MKISHGFIEVFLSFIHKERIVNIKIRLEGVVDTISLKSLHSDSRLKGMALFEYPFFFFFFMKIVRYRMSIKVRTVDNILKQL